MNVLEQFLCNVDRSGGPDACHPWTGPERNDKGYGAFRVDGKPEVAHRWLLGHMRGRPLAWPAEIGCHTCDNPPCCNLRHLYIGTHADNAADAIERSGHPAAARRALSRCPQGHEYSAENTLVSGGRRSCRECKRTQARVNARLRRRARGLKTRVRRADGTFEWVS